MITYDLKEMETRVGIEALFQYAAEGILITNRAGQMTRINPSTEKLLVMFPEKYPGQK